MAQSESIRVLCRVRPEEDLSAVVLGADGKTIKVRDSSGYDELTFGYDRVFSPYSTQSDVYDQGVADILDSLMKGIHAAVVAYGQTGTGKTHTMLGTDGDPGIIPRLLNALFDACSEPQLPDTQTFVSASYVQIYCEKVIDLLTPDGQECDIRENPSMGPWVTNCTDQPIASWREAEKLLSVGEKRRMVRETDMNEKSSRSHAVFIVSFCRRNLTEMSESAAQLYLCDLAGSECIDKSGDGSLHETKSINKSLLALRQVITAIVSRKDHVPFRDSKLTRLLQNSFGGSSKTCLMICVSPSNYNARESLATLRFGQHTKTIRNTPTVNVHRSAEELERMIREANDEIGRVNAQVRRLKRELVRQGVEDGVRVHFDADWPAPAAAAAGYDDPDMMPTSPCDRLVFDDMPRADSLGLVQCASFDADVPQHFLCPLSGQLMVTPVVCADGITYERGAIERYMERNCGRLPDGRGGEDGHPDDCFFLPNNNIRDQIADHQASH
eukprot:TRINITY_DN8209_c0_g1_i1.p1 TRINITY_DN8209_c0_g1~~TRINITY_DN8209_c0_g1_i1.p1  ORF type:complete len:498 (+),score=102.68 TRINITY_DN8209_c0_g1_i1:61-1554(+)